LKGAPQHGLDVSSDREFCFEITAQKLITLEARGSLDEKGSPSRQTNAIKWELAHNHWHRRCATTILPLVNASAYWCCITIRKASHISLKHLDEARVLLAENSTEIRKKGLQAYEARNSYTIRRRTCKPQLKVMRPEHHKHIISELEQYWSPEQIIWPS
jgi:hypothetical protein